jgi:hypothetical protein
MMEKGKRLQGSAENSKAGNFNKRTEGTYEKRVQGRREQWKGRGLEGREKKQARHKVAVANRINRLGRKRKRRAKGSAKGSGSKSQGNLVKKMATRHGKKWSRVKRLSKRRGQRRRRRRQKNGEGKGKVRVNARATRKAARNRSVKPARREWWLEKEGGRPYRAITKHRIVSRKKGLVVARRLVVVK